MTSTSKTEEKLSVIYSFQGRWESLLRRGKIGVFFRKRRPVSLPQKVFIYVGVPLKAVIGFAIVKSISEVSLAQANTMANEGGISEQELFNYIGNNGIVHAIKIHDMVIFKEPIGLSYLKNEFGFSPPQSFSIVDAPLEGALLRGVE